MSFELRSHALAVAASIHKETSAIVEAAKHFAAFLTGDGTTADAPKTVTRGRKAVGEVGGVAVNPEALAAAATAAATVAPVTQAVVTPVVVTAEAAVVTQPTMQQVADAIVDLANTVSRDAAVAILKKYGVGKVPELKPEQFVAVLADVKAAKTPAAPASAAAGLF